MRRRKNIFLLILLILLVGLSFIIGTGGPEKKRLSLDEDYFAITDSSEITRVIMKSGKINNVITRTNGVWRVNNKYPLDPSMKTVLLTVLERIRPQRPVPITKADGIREKLNNEGIKVEIYESDKLIKTFLAGGNGISVSYFMNEGEDPYIVHLPGYDSYVSGIFEVSENDWRDRFVFSTNWIGLKELTMEYPMESNSGFNLYTLGKDIIIDGIKELDTVVMMEYIENFQYFMVDQYIQYGDNPQYDSIYSSIPFAILKIDDTSFEKPVIIKFFRISEKEPLILCLIGDQPAIISSKRTESIFKKRGDFMRK